MNAVAPAVLGFTLGLRGLYDSLLLCFFVCCGISRLARCAAHVELPLALVSSLIFTDLLRYNVTAEEMSQGTGKA